MKNIYIILSFIFLNFSIYQNEFSNFDLLPLPLQDIIIKFYISSMVKDYLDTNDYYKLINFFSKINTLSLVNKKFLGSARNIIPIYNESPFKIYLEEDLLAVSAEKNWSYFWKLIIENLSLTEDQKNYALLHFKINENKELIKKILEFGAKDLKLPEVLNPGIMLVISIEKQNYFLLKLLLEKYKVNPNLALIGAIHHSYKPAIRLLYKYGAYINLKNKDGDSALIIAASKDKYNICKLLINLNIQIDAINQEGNSALIMAAKKGHKLIVKLLLENGADINLQNEWGHTALIATIYKAEWPLVKLLLNYNLNTNLITHDNYTALDVIIAEEENILDIEEKETIKNIIKILRAKGAKRFNELFSEKICSLS